MKILNWIINKYATPSLFIGGITMTLVASILLLAVLFNFKPYVSLKSGNSFGLTSYTKGIPFKMSFPYSIPDTSIFYQNTNENGLTSESGLAYINNATHVPPTNHSGSNWKTTYADTITTMYEVTDNTPQKIKYFTVSGFSFAKATAYIKVSNPFYRLIFMLPVILLLFLLSYCYWQLGLLLDSIQAGEIFEWINFKRLQNIGLTIIFFQLFCLLIAASIMISGNSWNLLVRFTSTISHFRTPIEIQAEPEYGFDWYWFIAGCIIVAIAKAFQKGYTLQQEQDLTI